MTRRLRFPRRFIGVGGRDARGAGIGSWTWSGACCADDGYARGVAGRASALDAGTVSRTTRGRCPHGEANERRPGAVGQQWGGMSRTSVTTSKQSCVVPLSGETARKHAKAERRPGETVAVRDRGGAGDPARRLGWRPTEKSRSGPPRQGRGYLEVLRPRRRGTAGRLSNAPCSGTNVRARVTVAAI